MPGSRCASACRGERCTVVRFPRRAMSVRTPPWLPGCPPGRPRSARRTARNRSLPTSATARSTAPNSGSTSIQPTGEQRGHRLPQIPKRGRRCTTFGVEAAQPVAVASFPRCVAGSARRGSARRAAPPPRRPRRPTRAGSRRRAGRAACTRQPQPGAARAHGSIRRRSRRARSRSANRWWAPSPAAHVVERDQEQVGPLDLLEQFLTARSRPRTASHSGPDSRCRTEVSSRKRPHRLGLAVQYLLG